MASGTWPRNGQESKRSFLPERLMRPAINQRTFQKVFSDFAERYGPSLQ